MFITLDGIDGGGKATQIELLCRWLRDQGHQVEAVRDPGSTEAGEAIRQLLLSGDLAMHRRTEALLSMAARCQLVQQRIRPALDAGRIVVSDRFLLANVVYQSVGIGEPVVRLWRLGHIATGGLRPDLTLLLDLPAETALARLQRPTDRMESRGVEYLRQVRTGFLQYLPRSSRHSAVVDATATVQQMHERIVQHVQRLLEQDGGWTGNA